MIPRTFAMFTALGKTDRICVYNWSRFDSENAVGSSFNASASCFPGLQKSAPTNLRTVATLMNWPDDCRTRRSIIPSSGHGCSTWDRMKFLSQILAKQYCKKKKPNISSGIKNFVEYDPPSDCIQTFLVKAVPDMGFGATLDKKLER